MKLEFLKAKFAIEFRIPRDFLSVFRKTFKGKEKGVIAVFCSVQFRDRMEEIMRMIEAEGFSTKTSKPFRTSIEGQMLGCDSYSDSLKLDLSELAGFVYVGDGYFHPNALLLAQEFEEEIKPVVLMNVVQGITEVIGREHIEKYLKKRKANLSAFHMNSEIGVFVTTKWGQEYKDSAMRLAKLYPDKNFYFFIGDNFLDSEMENFPYVACWINTACPRIGQDDIMRQSKPVINIKDVWKK